MKVLILKNEFPYADLFRQTITSQKSVTDAHVCDRKNAAKLIEQFDMLVASDTLDDLGPAGSNGKPVLRIDPAQTVTKIKALVKRHLPEESSTMPITAAKPSKKSPSKEDRLKELKKKYEHVDGGLRFDEEVGKYSVNIACTTKGCNGKRRVYTSDLFQVNVCEKCRDGKRKTSRNKANGKKKAKATKKPAAKKKASGKGKGRAKAKAKKGKG